MKTQCPNCKSRFNVNETNVGKQAKCPKCTKLFTIEPFIDTPAAVAAPAKGPEPVAPPVKNAEQAATPAKSAQPAESPAKSVAPVVPTPKAAEPIAPPAKVTAPQKEPAKIVEPAKEEKPESKAVSKKALSKIVFVYCWAAVRIIAGVLAALGLMLIIRKGDRSTLISAFAAADAFLVLSVLIELMLFYKMWAGIQDKQTSVSPVKAVGFLFIPVFNIYWSLYVLTGFAEDYNAFIQRYSVKTKELPIMLFLIYAVLFLLVAVFLTAPMMCIFAFFGRMTSMFSYHSGLAWSFLCFVIAAGIGHFITYILVAMKTCDGINALSAK